MHNAYYVVHRVNITYRVRTVEYFKFPNLEGAMVWEKGAIRKQENIFFNRKNLNINSILSYS